MVTFQLDPPTNCGTRFQDVDIVDNVFVYDIDSTTGHCAIKLGAGDSSAKTKGNVFERFRIEGNRIYRSPTAKLNESFNGFHLVQLLGRRGPAQPDRHPRQPSLRGRPDEAAGGDPARQPERRPRRYGQHRAPVHPAAPRRSTLGGRKQPLPNQGHVT